MAIADDFSVNSSGDIRYTGSGSTYTVLALHRWLQDLADNAESSGNDIIDISRATPSERSTDQIIQLLGSYNIDDTAAEYLYGGSIKQGTGATEEIYAGLKVLGAVNLDDTLITVIQDFNHYQFTTDPLSAFWGSQVDGGLNGNETEGILMRCLIKCRVNGVDIDKKQVRVQARQWGDSYDFFNVTLGEGESVAALGTTPDAQNTTSISTLQGWTGGDVPTNTEGYQGIDLNNGNGTKYYYSKWTYNTNSAGLKALWEWIKLVAGNNDPREIHSMNGEYFLGITHSFDYDAGGAFTEDENVIWGTQVTYDNQVGGSFTPGNYVRFSGGAAGRVLRDTGSIVTVALEDISQTITDPETITEYATSAAATGVTADVDTTILDNDKEGGMGRVLATTGAATGSLYVQLLVGKAPVDDLPIYGMTSTQTATVNGTVTARTVPKVFLGSYTGSLIGAYGIGVDKDDLTSSDSVQPLDGTTQTPPNNVTWTLSGLVVGDRILVGKKDTGNDFDFNEMTLNATLNTGSETVIDVGTGNIPADTPSPSGTLRVTLDDGRIRYVVYDSHDSDDEFTLNAGYTDWLDPNDATAGKGVMISFIDKAALSDEESFTVVYDAPRTLWVRVRDGGGTPIKTYEAQSSLGVAGGTATATRISDA